MEYSRWMRVVLCPHPGPPEVLHAAAAPLPDPAAGQVLVAVHYASVTFVETQVRAGLMQPSGATFPLVPGNGVAGTVVRVGPGVDSRWIGEPVVTATGGCGGYAEYAVAEEQWLHRVPAGLPLAQAAALLADGRTALALVRAAGIRPGDRVLVTAAAGGVGSLLVQLARAAGAAVVIALAGGRHKLALARSLGAQATVDYRRAGWDGLVQRATKGHGIDVAFDGVGGEVSRLIVELMAVGGRYVQHGMAGGPLYEVPAARARDLRILPWRDIAPGARENRALVDEALKLAATGRLRPVIGQVFPLESAAAAHAAMEARRAMGKTLLVVERHAGAGHRQHDTGHREGDAELKS